MGKIPYLPLAGFHVSKKMESPDSLKKGIPRKISKIKMEKITAAPQMVPK